MSWLEVRAHRGVFSCILLENKNINYVNSRGFVPPQSFTIKNILESATGKVKFGTESSESNV